MKNMKQRVRQEMNKNKKVLTGIAAAAVLLVAGVMVGSYFLTGGGRKSFPADGYVLEVTSEEARQTVAGLTFSMGTPYREKFPSSYIFHDAQGKKNKVDAASFIHYSDGSLSSFSDGTTVNMQDVGKGFLEFYLVREGMVMTKTSGGWEIDSNKNMIEFPEILWQLTDRKVMAASDEMSLELSGMEPQKVSGALEVTWVDKGIVQVASQEEVYQTVANGGKITYKSGAVLDLGRMAVDGADGEERFTLKEMASDMAGAGIAVQSESAKEWAPPEFNIYNDDGEDGEDGTGGENGESGETGEIGENGIDGETGEDGAQGQPGAAGAMGATGQGGGTIGGDSDDDEDDTREVKDFGSIRIRDMKYGYESASVTLKREDPDSTLTANTGAIEVREASTNRLIWQRLGLDFSNSNQQALRYDISGLSPDKEYVLLVKSRYSYESEEGGDPVAGEKIYIKRNFFTNAEGFTMVTTGLDKTGLTLDLEEFAASLSYDPSLPLYGMLCIRCGDLWETWPSADSFSADGNPVGLEPAQINEWKQKGVGRLDIGAMMRKRYQGTEKYESRKWTSDIPYTIELYTSTEKAGVWRSLAVTGTAGTELKKSAQVLEGRTLKEAPVIGKVSASASGGIYYDLAVSVEKDDDAAIRGYRFIITGSDGDKKVIESSGNKARWYYGDAISLSYKIECEVTYYDSEKDGVIKAQPANVIIPGAGLFDVNFAWDQSGGENENVRQIKGKIILRVDEDSDKGIAPQKLTIRVINLDTPAGKPEYRYDRTITYYLQKELQQNDSAAIALMCGGLENGVRYQISVWGTVEQDDYGDIIQGAQTQQSICLGSVIEKTAES